MDHHHFSFFGQKTGLLLDSGEKTQPAIYFRFLKKKTDGTWERSSNREGKNIKLNLLELISIIDIFEHPGQKWSTVHRFKQETTPITVENRGNNVVIFLQGYQKYLKFPETQLLTDLLKLIYKEKLENATNSNLSKFSGSNSSTKPYTKTQNAQNQTISKTQIQSPSNINFQNPSTIRHQNSSNSFKQKTTSHSDSNFYNPNQKHQKSNNSIVMQENEERRKDNTVLSKSDQSPNNWLASLQTKKDYYLLPGEIQARSQKAVAFKLPNKKSIWIPVSCISQAESGGLWVRQWFVQKKAEELKAII